MCVSGTDEALLCFLPFCLVEISNFESDIAFFAERHDPDTREWLFGDIETWFYAPGDSRAYVLLGDAGVGKSVMAGALAKRAKDAGYLGASYFCHYKDETRNDPKILLGTIACQLCKCSVQYSNEVGGEGGVRMTLADNKLSIRGLFTKLLQEPLGKCTPCEQRKLVIIDALDETEYKTRDDFLELVMHGFPRLPKWLLFFITSRPEDTVQCTLENYNPCIRICAGNDEHHNVYHQHEQDIKRYLVKNIDFSRLQFSAEDITKTCSGLFLYAFYMVGVFNDPIRSDNIGQLTHIFPGDISNFFQKNFERIYDRMGAELFRTLFGCVVAAPSPIPLSLISFLLKRERTNLDEQVVIDTVSIFLVLRASDQTLSFLHNLIPSWLTDRKRARRFFVDTIKAGEYLKEIVLEFLPSVANVSSVKHSSIELDLLDYVLHVGVRLLCRYDDSDSAKVIYECLTSCQFIQKRIQKSRIGVYSVIRDLKLSVRCQSLCDTEKEILQGVCRALEKNIYTLSEFPHLLPSCLQMASKAVKSNMKIPDGVSTTLMEWSWLPFPAAKASPNKGRRCFAFSSDRKLLAEVKDGFISFYNSCSLEKLFGPVETKQLAEPQVLPESFDDNVLLSLLNSNILFSVQRRIFKTLPLKTVHLSCEWSSFTLDRQHVVVKCESLPPPTCWLCLLNHLCLWAKLEIAQRRQREPLCRCFPHKLEVTRNKKYPQLESRQGSRITAMRPLLNLLSEMKCDEWCSLLEKVQLNREDGTFLVSDCERCKTAEEYEALTLQEVRHFVVIHYSEIFKYQVRDVRTGETVFNQALILGAKVSPFNLFFHLGTAFEVCGTLFTGIDKALSLSNIALLSTICHHLLFREGSTFDLTEDDTIGESREKASASSTYTFTDLSNDDTYGVIEKASVLSAVSPIMAFELDNLPDEGKKVFFSGSIPCLSPGVIWVAKPFVKYAETVVYLFRVIHPYRQQHSNNPEYVVKEVAQFGFTNDHSFFLYLSVHNTLHAFSLQSGTILQSVSGVNPLFFNFEGQAGYHFQAFDEGKTLFLEDFPCDFLKHFLIPSARKPLQVNFVTADTFVVLFADSSVASFQATGDRCTDTLFSKHFLGSLGHWQVKYCAFSSDGKLIAAHHGNMITLHDTIGQDGCRFLCSVFEADYEFKVIELIFSADNTLLLFCIVRDGNWPFAFVWDVRKKVQPQSFDPPGLLSENFCCCLTIDNKIVLCTELYIEIWDQAASPCHLLTRLALDVLYNETDKITFCTVSPNNDLLACCVVDRILLYSLNSPTNQPYLNELPRAHLGKIEFCRFLNGNRYIISYGIDDAVFLWDLVKRTAISFIRIPLEGGNISFMTVSPKGNQVFGCTSFGGIFQITLKGLKSETLSSERFQLEGMRKKHNVSTFSGAVCSGVEKIAEETDTSKLVEEMDFMCPSDNSENSDGDE